MLPISKHREEIVEAVQSNAVTIVSAETGSGKSTQIPQYLSDIFDQVIVTEPRIMAAKTLAKRVSEEMGVTLGDVVGFRTAYESCASPSSRILFCTDGLQLIRTIFDKDNTSEKVLIIDEVHEWNLNIEVLIAWCKHMYSIWNTKVVLMSATMDAANLANFFGDDVAVLNIPGTMYDVFVEERPESQLISTIKENIVLGKNILVFVPGKSEINKVMKELKECNATVLPLHGEMDWDDQKKVFEKYPNSKVIVATNVAQTSLTIPDIDVVVDTGEARVSIAENGIQGLFLKDISRSDIKQRKGRAGRTKEGKYFLCSDTPIRDREEFNVPEIQRSILDRVVLQIAEVGLDAEKLKFYHQPEMDAILKAKEELTIIGALSDNRVTELGHKLVRIPVSVQLARMILEAEKYGVTEQVLTIAAIIEMGGLLTKEVGYYRFTHESNSDLLAELDVWNNINEMENIDFKELGIKKKAFFRIKEHIRKLKEVLYGIVEIKSKDDRNAILKSCLHGLVSNVYVQVCGNWYNNNGGSFRLDRKSCVSRSAQIVVGIPKTIEYKYGGSTKSKKLVGFATQIDTTMLFELVPNLIKEETTVRYSAVADSVQVTVKKYYAGIFIDLDEYYDRHHPEYDRLKAEYESKNYKNFGSTPQRQEFVVIDGKKFKIDYFWNNRPLVFIDMETLFTTTQTEVFLDSGEKVYFSVATLVGREETNLLALKNAFELKRIKRLKEKMRNEFEKVISSINDLLKNADKIGKIVITMNNGSYGDEPIYAYGCIELKKNSVTIRLIDDEEVANSNTLEALRFLFYKEIQKKYGESKFSHQNGKKKKILTKSEMEAKNDFYSLVRELMIDLTIETVQETLDFLEEYYQELMQ